MADIDWGIEWQNAAPDTQTKVIEAGITWAIKAVPEEDPGAVLPDTAVEPVVTGYEILAIDFVDDLIVDETNTAIGVQVSGDVGNPFVFQKIGYVTPKYTGSDQTIVPTVADLPDYSTFDIFAFIPSTLASMIQSITIRATAVGNREYQITGVFNINTINEWSQYSVTLNEILAG